MNTIHERLAWARKQARFESMAAAARALADPEPTYRSHENGTRVPDEATLRRYGKAFGVGWSWLMTGAGDPKAAATPDSSPVPDAPDGSSEKARLMRGLADMRGVLDKGIDLAPISETGYTMALIAAEELVAILRKLRDAERGAKSEPTIASAP